ncbi:hypothetical protein D3C81_1193920 [compost metagenome]
MHRALAILAEEYLVQIRLHDVALVVMQLQQHRHHRFVELAPEAALVGEEVVLHQLLGQGTAALAQVPGGGVDPDGAGDGLQRNAVVVPELAVFHCHQGVEQIWRDLIQLDQDAVLMVRRVQAADHQRFHARHGEIATVGPGEAGDIIPGEAHADTLRRLGTFVELEAAGIQLDRIAGHRRRTGAVRRTFTAIAEGIQLAQEVLLVQLEADEELQRPGIDLGRNGPALAGEFLLDSRIEINGKTCDHDKADQSELCSPAQPLVQLRRGFTTVTGTGGSGTRHGGALYVLYPQGTDAAAGSIHAWLAAGSAGGGCRRRSFDQPADDWLPQPGKVCTGPPNRHNAKLSYLPSKDLP